MPEWLELGAAFALSLTSDENDYLSTSLHALGGITEALATACHRAQRKFNSLLGTF